MKAAVVRDRTIVVADIPAPEPGPGEVLVKTLACGICGSDLHALKHADRFAASYVRADGTRIFDFSRDIVMGHEFCAEVVDYGPDCARGLAPGTRVCSMPMLLRDTLKTVGYDNEIPGGYGEYMLLTESFLLPVPNGLPTEHAALTEPMAIGRHAVGKAQLVTGDLPLVIGCGPVGLAVIADLKRLGVGPIIAADFSPRRRALAETMGADVVVDPKTRSPYVAWSEVAQATAPPVDPFLAMIGVPPRPAVVFECVGVPGLIDQITRGVPRGTRVVVAGVCMERDALQPVVAISKELSLQFTFFYDPMEFAGTLTDLAEGRLHVAPMITGRVGLDGVDGAFKALASPEQHAEILVEPARA